MCIMKNLLKISVSTIIFVVSITLPNVVCNGTYAEQRIVGGEICSIKKYPFMVMVYTSEGQRQMCGGTLIDRNWVLTAAHCLSIDSSQYMAVYAGMETRFDFNQARSPIQVYPHPGYSNKTHVHDIGLIQLETPFKLVKDLIETIDLPSKKNTFFTSAKPRIGTVVGWGTTEPLPPNKPDPMVFWNISLRFVHLPVYTNSECYKIFPGFYNPLYCCTYEDGKSACLGDSGGPLLHNHVQYGIVSFSYGCANWRLPGYFVRVDKYLDYIKNITGGISSSSMRVPSRGLNTIAIFLIYYLI